MKSSSRSPGLIVVISSPSGTGKTTICHRLIKKHSDFAFSVSTTTRPHRKGEINGVNYHFTTDEKFDAMVRKREFVEWANVFGYRYGTPKSEIKRAISNHKVLLCDIDVQGGMSIKKKYDDAVTIFVIPPSMAELKRRLSYRRTDSAEQRKIRLKTAVKELSYWRKYDYVVLNDDLKKATAEVDMIIAAERARTVRRGGRRYWTSAQARLLNL